MRVEAQPVSPTKLECRVEPIDYRGWQAQQISNRWVQLIVVPQNGGRLMQVTFDGHAFLFVNPKLAGKYFPPSPGQWFNYGGDKIWLLPEGNTDEHHWVGNSDVLDDGPFAFRKVSEGKRCEVELTGPFDPHTGVQFTRTIVLDSDSPRIAFHTMMKNMSGHSIEWSMQTVSQYDTAIHQRDADSPPQMNHDFEALTPANPASAYLNRYHVRFGPAENHSVSVHEDGLFTVHYIHMAAEFWLDSTAGWLAVVDGASQYAMVERFDYEAGESYPGKASVIFWTNGPEMRLGSDGNPSLSSDADALPYYLEAEINSPMCRLRPGASCTLDTEWFPTRSGNEFYGVSDAGVTNAPLTAVIAEDGKIKLAGTFGGFFPGRLMAHFYDEHGAGLGSFPVIEVDPTKSISLDKEVAPIAAMPARVALHLEDENGVDRGALGEVRVQAREHR